MVWLSNSISFLISVWLSNGLKFKGDLNVNKAMLVAKDISSMFDKKIHNLSIPSIRKKRKSARSCVEKALKKKTYDNIEDR